MNVWVRVRAAQSVKLVGVMAAHFADYSDGSNIHPGNIILGAVSGEMSTRAVINALAQIREWELMWRYCEGSKQGRRAMADMYRLTIPQDILDRVPMLDPAYRVPTEPVDKPP
jgi:hypothetical protein